MEVQTRNSESALQFFETLFVATVCGLVGFVIGFITGRY